MKWPLLTYLEKRKGTRRSRRLNGEDVPDLNPITPPSAMDKPKKTRKKVKPKKAKNPPTPKVHPDPIRCCICMEWHNAPEEEVYGGTIWTCVSCRSMPSVIMEMRKELATVLQTNKDLVACLAARIADNDTLRNENAELRNMLNKRPTASANKKHLVIADASLRLANQNSAKCEVKTKQNVTLNDCKLMLTQSAKSEYGRVTIAISATDCIGDTAMETLDKGMHEIVLQAKALAPKGDVQISSILPCLNNQHTQRRIEELNSATEVICNRSGVTFIHNDPGFRLGDGDINEGFYEPDGFSINSAGRAKLLRNLQLADMVKTEPSIRDEPWNDVVKRKPKVKAQKAPCWNCGEPHHTSNVCRYKKRLTCNKCLKQGHKSSLCPPH